MHLPEEWEWSERHLEGPKLVRRPSQRVESGQEALPENREWSGGSPGESGVFGKPFWRAGSVWEALMEWSGGPSRGLGVAGSGREALPEGRE